MHTVPYGNELHLLTNSFCPLPCIRYRTVTSYIFLLTLSAQYHAYGTVTSYIFLPTLSSHYHAYGTVTSYIFLPTLSAHYHAYSTVTSYIFLPTLCTRPLPCIWYRNKLHLLSNSLYTLPCIRYLP